MSLAVILAAAAVMVAGSVLLYLRRRFLAFGAACGFLPVTAAVDPAA